MGVNEHYVSDVRRIYENAPTLLQPMRLGSLTIPQALKQIAGQKEKRLDKIRARAYHKNDESLPTLREKLIESGGVYLIKYSQVHHDSEKVEAELERISATLWETFENNNTKRPGLENSADSDTIEID